MITHIVLFTPRRELPVAARTALVHAFETALRDIPSIRRARAGRRVRSGRPYDALMQVDYEFVAILEFDDRAGLQAYLEHASHAPLAARFFDAFDHALMYDFECDEGTAGLAALLALAH